MLSVKQNDTARKITDTLTSDGSPINLTGAAVKLCFKKADGTQAIRSASVVSQEGGTVEYKFVEGDLDVEGEMRLEWRVTFPTLDRLTVPDNDHILLKVIGNLYQA